MNEAGTYTVLVFSIFAFMGCLWFARKMSKAHPKKIVFITLSCSVIPLLAIIKTIVLIYK